MSEHAARSPLLRRIHVDTDPGLDDLLALALAFASPELRIMALTTVAGNASLEHVTDNARRFMKLVGLDLPIGKGAARPLRHAASDAISVHGVDGRAGIELPDVPSASLPDAREVLRHSLLEDRVDSVVALGPLTNLAALIAEDPQLFESTEIVWMGGSLCGGNHTPVAEFNCYADPAAAEQVLGSGLAVRVVGLDVTSGVLLRRRDVPAAPFGHAPRGRMLAAALDALMEVERPVHGEACAVLHDPTAIATLFDEHLFRFEPRRIRTDTSEGAERGRMCESDDARSSVRYAVEVQSERVARLFLSRVAGWCGAEAC